ncbi:unnamed protein product [Mycena citricolor]|uniref:DNA 3'-5' helicase n=1 Tax=Mycena citricolor TaxID=2018698 RepID=A0AAD2JX92_9AGAR|nr:unnamed protein product [Mycena citricolor]
MDYEDHYDSGYADDSGDMYYGDRQPQYNGEEMPMQGHALYYSDEIEDSSPCPPERIPVYTQAYQHDDIDDYDDEAPYYEDDLVYHQSLLTQGQQGYEEPTRNQQQHPQSRNRGRFGNGGFQSARNNSFPWGAGHLFLPARPIFQRQQSVFYPLPQSQMSRQVQSSQSQAAFRRPISMLPPPPPHPALQTHPPASARGSNPRNSSGIRLRPISDLPDIFRGIFKFGVFNAVQSSCFDTVFQSEENMVISAPTGSGKTVLFELAIIRALKEAKASGKSIKCVYMAPTKALCSERHRDWASKFDPLGFKCCELTGDTVVFGKGAWGDAKNANIIVTTGEKWDSLTRHWGDHDTVLSQIQLFLVDEVHILNESRGSTLEVVISRMKTRGSAVRFVLVSATVPNIDDIAAWIGNSQRDAAAKVFEFGEQFRPCKLTRHVIGVARQKNENDFSFARKLDFKLFGALQTYSVGKPILVFVSTRKGVCELQINVELAGGYSTGVSNTAEQLLKDYNEAQKAKQRLPWAHPPRIDKIFHEKRLIDFVSSGIGIHHAGMTIDDRRAVEDLYLKGTLRVVVATSTLAVGVNLPAHTVVIKGVQTFQNNQSVEYSDLDIMQMIGRAYRELAQGTTIVESSLHTNLSEHLNSEIGLGTITTIRGAKEWLRGSFLFQRVRKNPAHYALGKGENQTWEERVDDMVTHSVDKLRETRLIAPPKEGDNSGLLKSTEFGDIMSKVWLVGFRFMDATDGLSQFYIKQSTMSAILALPEKPTLREVLEVICASEELAENKLRTSEKTVYNKLRRHNDIRFEVKKVERTSDKVLLLIQAILGGISLNTAEYKTSDSHPISKRIPFSSMFAGLPGSLLKLPWCRSAGTAQARARNVGHH